MAISTTVADPLMPTHQAANSQNELVGTAIRLLARRTNSTDPARGTRKTRMRMTAAWTGRAAQRWVFSSGVTKHPWNGAYGRYRRCADAP